MKPCVMSKEEQEKAEKRETQKEEEAKEAGFIPNFEGKNLSEFLFTFQMTQMRVKIENLLQMKIQSQ